MILNMVCGGGAGGGAGGDIDKSQIIVTVETGSTVTCTMGEDVRTASEEDGKWRFTGLDNGIWTVSATKDGKSASAEVVIDKLTIVYVELAYRKVPVFTYTGDYALVNDDDTPLTDVMSDNWKIRILTSGTLNFTSFGTWDGNMDVFLVGGGGGGYGGGGGGGGYTTTAIVSVKTNTDYEIVIGAGGEKNNSGGQSSAFEKTANGGTGSTTHAGGAGGSGGGSSGGSVIGGNGGSNGGNGTRGNNNDSMWAPGGTGQGTSTREFYSLDQNTQATLYSGGGGGNGSPVGTGGSGGGGKGKVAGGTNTGGGGGGDAAGGSGIVVIRNHR